MTDYKKIFLDTTPVIYFLDEDVNFGEKIMNIFSELLENEVSMITSVITCEEYMVYPYKTNNFDKIKAFYEFMMDCDIPIKSIDVNVAEKAAQIRATYKDFKGMDSLQLATACIYGCDLFLTNDKQLRQFKDIKCITIDEWNEV